MRFVICFSTKKPLKKRQANSSNNLILQAKDDLIKVKDEMIMLLNKDKEQVTAPDLERSGIQR
jgi:hypothetical protein